MNQGIVTSLYAPANFFFQFQRAAFMGVESLWDCAAPTDSALQRARVRPSGPCGSRVLFGRERWAAAAGDLGRRRG